MYIDPIARQTSHHALLISCDKNNRRNVLALELVADEHYVLTPKPALRATPMLFEPNQIQPAISPQTLTAQVPEFFPTLIQQNSGVVFYSRNNLIRHLSFCEKTFQMNF